MLIIKNANISTGSGNETKFVNIVIDREKILRIDDTSAQIPDSADIIDANGLLVIPGAIDPHVHFNTPGYEIREDFLHGTMAAAAGGVTTVIDMPDTSIPPVTNIASLESKLMIISEQAYVDFALWGGVSGNSVSQLSWFSDMEELWKEGVVGFKTYLISGMDTFRELSIIQLGQVMQHAKKIGALVALHAEDKDTIRELEAELRKQNKNSVQDYYQSRKDPSEELGVLMGLGLAKQTRCRLHIVHLASGHGVEKVRFAKMVGLDLSAETCPHYLNFTYDDFRGLGSLLKTAPVVKTKRDQDALWRGLIDGSIDFIATDHAASLKKDKNTGSAWADYGGVPGSETLLPFIFSEGYKREKLSLERLIDITSKNSARRFGLYPKKGAMQKGSDADLAIIDPDLKWKVDEKKMHSKAGWSIFDGMEMTGKVVKTIVRGEVVFDDKKGIVGNKGYGKLIRR